MVLVNRPHTLFSTRFLEGLYPRGNAVANATVFVFTRQLTASGTTVTTTETEVYVGPARVQPLRGGTEADTPGSATINQAVQLQLPLPQTASTEFLPGMGVRITAAPNLPSLVGWTGTVKDVGDAPNAIERTLVAEFDTGNQ